MPMPQEYQIAAQVHDAFLAEAGEALGLATRHQTYTAVQAVLLAFRRRLDADDVLRFAGALPAMLRAMFVAGWDADEAMAEFGGPTDWAGDVASLRRHHNFAPGDAIPVVAGVLRRHVDPDRFDKALAGLPPQARQYWEM